MYENNAYMNGYPGFQVNPQMYGAQNIPMPNYQNSLTEEEIALLRNARPSNILNITIDPIDETRAICNHKHNGMDCVKPCNDGTGDVFCPLCGERWHGEFLDDEQIDDALNKIITQMQNIKWAGEMPTNLIREYFKLIPILQKFKDINKYGMKNFDRFLSARGFLTANDANVYQQYDYLTRTNGYYNSGMYGQQPMYGYGYGAPQQAAPMNNPMQAQPYGQGYNPNMGQQPNGTYYQSYGQQGYNMGYGYPQQQQQQINNGGLPAPQQQPYAPNFTPAQPPQQTVTMNNPEPSTGPAPTSNTGGKNTKKKDNL